LKYSGSKKQWPPNSLQDRQLEARKRDHIGAKDKAREDAEGAEGEVMVT
jgi:hypothetical protein